MRRTLSLALIVASVVSVAEEQAPKREPNRTAEETGRIVRSMEPQFRAILARLKVPGVAIAVVKDDKVVYLEGLGYRNLEKKLPFTPDTICQIASCSKAFCSTTAVIAASEGKLDLNASPRTLLPDFKLKDPEADKGMTIADLMNHTSGLPRTDTAWYSGRVDANEAMLLLGLGEPTYPFRYVGQYSNMGVETAGLAVAAAYGKPWSEVVEEKITRPLGMTSTWRRTLPEKAADRVATGYFVDFDGTVKPEDVRWWPAIAAAGGLQSTARDLATWVRFHLNKGEVDGKRLLPAKWLEEAHRARFSYAGSDTNGLGWFQSKLRGVLQINHSGYLPGFETRIDFIPELRLGVAVVSNNAGRNAPRAVIAAIFDRLVGKQDLREVKRVAKLGGTYFSADGGHVALVEPITDEISVMLDAGLPRRFRRVSPNQFSTTDPHDEKMTVTFSDDPKRRGKKRFTLEKSSARSEFAVRADDYRTDQRVGDLLRLTADRIGSGAARAGRILEAKYRVRYVTEGVEGIGVFHRAPTGSQGQLEQQWALGRPIHWSHLGMNPNRITTADDDGRVEDGGDPSLMALMNGYCNELAGLAPYAKAEIVGEVDWTGERAYMVRLEPKTGGEIIEFIGKNTHLPLRRQAGVGFVETYSEYQGIDGVQIPTKFVTRDGNFAESVYTVTSAKMIDRDVHWAFNASTFDGKLKPRYPDR